MDRTAHQLLAQAEASLAFLNPLTTKYGYLVMSIAVLMWFSTFVLYLGSQFAGIKGWIDKHVERRRYGHPLINTGDTFSGYSARYMMHWPSAAKSLIKFSTFMVIWFQLHDPNNVQFIPLVIAIYFGTQTIRYMLICVPDYWKWRVLESKGVQFHEADDGERYRITYWGTNGPRDYLYEKKSYEERKKEEIQFRQGLHARVITAWVKVLVFAAFVYAIAVPIRDAFNFPFYDIAAILVIGYGLSMVFVHDFGQIYSAWSLGKDGYIAGALVRDKKPERKGRNYAEAHTTHGTAQFAEGRAAARKLAR